MSLSEKEIKASASKIAHLLNNSKKTVVLTGAGISAESGIDPFRGKDGLWARYDPEEYAYIDSFLKDPAKVWKMIKELTEIILNASPNPGHYSLAELEEMGFLSSVITQNIDGLHQAAGSRNVIEFHGNNRSLLCLACNKKYVPDLKLLETLPPLCRCGGILRPDVVFFGEQIPIHALLSAQKEAESCDLMLVIGTSALVSPASEIPLQAKVNGAKIIEINPEETPLTHSVSDFSIRGTAGTVLPKVVEELKCL